MALILSLESSSEVCSVALAQNGLVVSSFETKEAFSHTRKMTLFIGEVMEQQGKKLSDIDAVCVSHGPGSYTGLRVSASTAKGICYALDKPLLAINTLHTLAYKAKEVHPESIYVPMIDARRMEVYYAVLDAQLKEIYPTENLILETSSFDHILTLGKPVVLCGTGIAKAALLFEKPGFQLLPMDCSAEYMAELAEQKFVVGDFEDMVSYEPFYFKPPKVTKSKKALF
jgi:tRNA threonylcarbamoyladenosine biosynthesis protein TsaB